MEGVYNKLDLLSLRDETVEVSIRRSESSSARPRLRSNVSLHKPLGTLPSAPTPVKRRRPGNVLSNLLSDISPCLGAPGAAPPGGEEKAHLHRRCSVSRIHELLHKHHTQLASELSCNWERWSFPSASQHVSLFIVLFTETLLFNVCNSISHDVSRCCERPSESARRLWHPVLIPPCDGSSLKGWHSFRWVEASWWMQSVFVASEVRATVAPRGRIQLGRTVSVNMESSFQRFHQHVLGLCQTPTRNHARCARREELLALSFMISYLRGWKYFQLSTFNEGTN